MGFLRTAAGRDGTRATCLSCPQALRTGVQGRLNGTGSGAQGAHRPTHGRARAGGCPGRARHRPCVRRAGRELSRCARWALRRAPEIEAGDLPLRGGRGAHGRSVRQTEGPAGGGDGDARPRRLPWRDRRARRDAGQHAAAAVRRPDPARGCRPRCVPGGRLPADVQPARQVGDPDRPGEAHSGNRRACDGCRGVGPAWPGGHRAVRRDAEGHDRGARPAARHGIAATSRSRRVGAIARHARPIAQTARGAWRLMLDRRQAAPRSAISCWATIFR